MELAQPAAEDMSSEKVVSSWDGTSIVLSRPGQGGDVALRPEVVERSGALRDLTRSEGKVELNVTWAEFSLWHNNMRGDRAGYSWDELVELWKVRIEQHIAGSLPLLSTMTARKGLLTHSFCANRKARSSERELL